MIKHIGDSEFINLAVQFAYGSDVDLQRIAAIQSLSGTGACRVGGEFYARFLPKGTHIYIPDPTWGNHIAIFKNCGLDVQRYRYFDYANNVSFIWFIFVGFVLFLSDVCYRMLKFSQEANRSSFIFFTLCHQHGQ